MKRIDKKKAGFTLVESLMAVVILILLSALATKGISLAIDAYSKVVDSANAQLLLSTTISEIRDELSTGSDFKVASDSNSITYISSKTGDESIIGINEDGFINITEYVNNNGGIDRLLVSDAAANKNLKCTYSGIDYSDKIITINNLEVTRVGSSNVLAGLDEFVVKIG